MRAALLTLSAFALLALVSASCPNQCSGHGRCGQYDKCTCFYRWSGNDCSQRLCKEGFAWSNGDQYNPHGWAECSNKGVCDRSTGECQCFAEYEGAACERSSCPNDCSGHGTCEYAHEISNMETSAWEYWKVQGCRCDGGFEGQDCSQRRCPRGDDPLTTVSSFDGDEYTVEITFPTDPTSAANANYFYFEIVDLYGNTDRSRAFSYSDDDTDGDLGEKLKYLLLDIPSIRSLVSASVTQVSGQLTLEFKLDAPTRISELRVKTEKCVDGCYPYMPASFSVQTVASNAVTTAAAVLVETAECSNRGICDRSLGQCVCFTGHYGLACQYQTVLV